MSGRVRWDLSRGKWISGARACNKSVRLSHAVAGCDDYATRAGAAAIGSKRQRSLDRAKSLGWEFRGEVRSKCHLRHMDRAALEKLLRGKWVAVGPGRYCSPRHKMP